MKFVPLPRQAARIGAPVPGMPGLRATADRNIVFYDPQVYNEMTVRRLAPALLARIRPVYGQPGTYELRGLGDPPPSVASFRSQLAAADAKFLSLRNRASKLLTTYGPIDRSVLDRIRAAIAGKGGGGWYAHIGAAEFSGVLWFFLSGTATSLSLLHAMMNGPSPEAQIAFAVPILAAANGVLSAVDRLLTTSTTTESAIQAVITAAEGAARDIGRRLGLDGLGFTGAEIAAGVVVALVVISILYLGFSQYESMQAATNAANTACTQPGASCSTEQWTAIYERALAAGSSLSILPNLGRALESAGSGLAWGIGLGVLGLFAYGAWVTAPAASIARERLRTRASA